MTIGNSIPTHCSICGTALYPVPKNTWVAGHNARPISEDNCCTKCLNTVVMPTRKKLIEELRAKKANEANAR